MATLRIGIVGAGAIARLSCREIVGHADARIVAAADPSAERLAELRDAFAIPRTYADASALFADAEVDAVYIAVPNLHHAPLATAALQAGKHVLLDKPFATSLAAAEGVAAAARASGKVFMLGMNQRFARGSQKMRQRVLAGDLGEVYHVKAFWRRRSGIPRIGSWFGNKAISGGGGLLDIGVHMLDLALHLIGNFDVRTVSGVAYTKFGNRGLGDGAWGLSERDQASFDVDDFASAFIRLSGGVSVQLDAGWAMHQEHANEQDVLLYGTEAGASVIGEKLFRNGAGRGEYEVLQSPAADVQWRHASRFHHFIDVALGREPALVTIDEALAVQRILDAIYASAASGREVAFD
jgi:predicted dehydrogenase